MKDFLKMLEDFCTDNYIWVLVGGALLLVVIILIAASSGSAAKRRSRQAADHDKQREYFLEGEYDAVLKGNAGREKSNKEKEEDIKIPIPEEHPVSINISIEKGSVQIGYGEREPKDEAETPEPEESENMQQISCDPQTIVMEKINIVKADAGKKFGRDNLNTSRSGRVYSEEELQEKIKE